MIDVVVGDNNDKNREPELVEAIQPDAPEESTQKIKRRRSVHSNALLLFTAGLTLYIFLAILSINNKYVDFGDGNYLYISWRLTEGDLLYKDLPSPQPPLLLFLGAFWLNILDGDPTLVRLWQVLQHALTACCIWGIAAWLFKRPIFSAWAACIYLFLPEGVWWAAGYQSEPLLILLLCFNMLLFIKAVQEEKPTIGLYASGFIAALCCYTNMTALPYILLQWFFVGFRFRRFFTRYSMSLVIPGIIIFIIMWFYSQGLYIEHVFFRQVGTYPNESIFQTLKYFIFKLYTEGGDIVFFEGGFLFAAFAGLLLYTSEDSKDPVIEYVLWWAVFSIGSIIFVTKGGTVEYIFTLGEPAVALFSAYFLLTLFAASGISFRLRSFRNPMKLGKCTMIVCLLLPVLMIKPLSLLYRTFSNKAINLSEFGYREQSVFEVSGDEMDKAALYIQSFCPPTKTMIAPPYYAFLGKRKLAENSSSLFILGHAYYTEWERLAKSRDLNFDLPDRNEVEMFDKEKKDYNKEGTYYNTQSIYDLDALFKLEPQLREEYPAITLFLDLRDQIRNREVGLILQNMQHFFFYVPPLHQAIRDFCKPMKPEQQLKLNNREEVIVAYRVI